ncbi:MAG: hypothetical protein HZT41_15175 [Dechloromonas sp.]|nr:MAG: hypothetical protein HZT41_15175 [Dechloromonas sp.]
MRADPDHDGASADTLTASASRRNSWSLSCWLAFTRALSPSLQLSWGIVVALVLLLRQNRKDLDVLEEELESESADDDETAADSKPGKLL